MAQNHGFIYKIILLNALKSIIRTWSNSIISKLNPNTNPRNVDVVVVKDANIGIMLSNTA